MDGWIDRIFKMSAFINMLGFPNKLASVLPSIVNKNSIFMTSTDISTVVLNTNRELVWQTVLESCVWTL